MKDEARVTSAYAATAGLEDPDGQEDYRQDDEDDEKDVQEVSRHNGSSPSERNWAERQPSGAGRSSGCPTDGGEARCEPPDGPANGTGGVGGQAIYIQHDNGDVTVYGHIETIYVDAGRQVVAGQEIAGVGSRGFSTGPYLHFEVQQGGIGGTRVDPLDWLAARGVYLWSLGRKPAKVTLTSRRTAAFDGRAFAADRACRQ